GRFAAFIQPLLPCKLTWSEEEKEMRAREREYLSKVANYQNNVIDNQIPHLIQKLKTAAKLRGYNFVFDLNEIIKDSTESLFTNYWIHCNARGNALCAQHAAQVLRQKNWL
ncbi:MAG: hypothetical protein K2F85_05630, partial [Helicobacter sp.]|nr:hypothetical protein [Helicobacter sp.]